MIAVVLSQRLDEALNWNLASIGPDADTCQIALVQRLQFLDQINSKLREFRNRLLPGSLTVATIRVPRADVHWRQCRAALLQYLANPERVEVGVAVSNVPEMRDKRKLIFDWSPLKHVRGQRGHRPRR